MKYNELKELIKEEKNKENLNLVKEGGFSRLRQIMLGQVPSVRTIGILTAENPGGQPASREENNKRNADLMSDLRERNYGPIKVKGRFGEEESSFVVPHMERSDALEFGDKYGQEAVIWGQKREDEEGEPRFEFQYIEIDGFNVLDTRDVSIGSIDAQEREDYFSEKAGRKFYIPFFDDQYEAAKPVEGGRRISFAESEVPESEEALALVTSLKERQRVLSENDRTSKSLWHHRGAMKNELRSLQTLIDYTNSKEEAPE